MADIELVIKLSEKNYEHIKRLGAIWIETEKGLSTVSKALLNGIPLPKGHGRLGDLDALEKEIVNGIKAGNYEEGYETFAHINDMDGCIECVKLSDTIIEADKGRK